MTLAHAKGTFWTVHAIFTGANVAGKGKVGALLNRCCQLHTVLFSALSKGGGVLKGCTCTSGLAIEMAPVQLKLWPVWSRLVPIPGWQAYRASTPPTGEQRRRCSRLFGQPGASVDGPYGKCGMCLPT